MSTEIAGDGRPVQTSVQTSNVGISSTRRAGDVDGFLVDEGAQLSIANRQGREGFPGIQVLRTVGLGLPSERPGEELGSYLRPENERREP
jgi:hypothetical protein